MNQKHKKLQYHPSFYSAIELELFEIKGKMICSEEHILNTKPNEIDLLIELTDETVEINSGIGAIFKKYNIFEYKSPNAALGRKVYHRTMAYTELFIAYAKGDIYRDEISVTFIRERKPKKLLNQFLQTGFTITEFESGIYHIRMAGHVDMQVIVIRELGKHYKWITKLTSNLKPEDLTDLKKELERLDDLQDIMDAESVLDLMMRLNKDKQWLKEEKAMGEIRELFKKEFEERDKKIDEQNSMIINLNEQLQSKDEQLQSQNQQLQDSAEENSRLKEEILKLKKQLGGIAAL